VWVAEREIDMGRRSPEAGWAGRIEMLFRKSMKVCETHGDGSSLPVGTTVDFVRFRTARSACQESHDFRAFSGRAVVMFW
jgi:hypothetical protein